jgi:hypothetical protein
MSVTKERASGKIAFVSNQFQEFFKSAATLIISPNIKVITTIRILQISPAIKLPRELIHISEKVISFGQNDIFLNLKINFFCNKNHIKINNSTNRYKGISHIKNCEALDSNKINYFLMKNSFITICDSSSKNKSKCSIMYKRIFF